MRQPGTVDYEAEVNANAERQIWMQDARMWRLGSMRGPGQSLSEVILRVAASGRII